MRKFSFGTIINSHNDIPEATHLPFLIEMQNNEVILTSHFAKANQQAHRFTQHDSLVIFIEPHAYISPKHYEKELNVPTWNYISVHAYGKAVVIDAEDELLAMMAKMIGQYDIDYLKQWNNLPAEFKTKMFNGIVAFRIKVTSLQAKNKLSQNRSETERKNIISSFEKSTDINEIQIAEYMKNAGKR